MPFVTGNKIAIINVYDGCITLTDAPTIFSDYTVNGVTYSSVNDLQSVLLDVIYTRNSLTNAAITLTTIGNSGAATLTGVTLNIPTYTLAGLGGQPLLTNPITGTGATNFLPKFTGASTLGNSIVSESGAAISVAGNIQTDGNANRYVKSTGFISNQLGQLSDFGGGDAGYYFVAGGGIQFVSGGANRMLLNSSGNVGIGTTSPANLLTLKASVVAPIIDINRSGGGQGKNSGILFRDQVNNEQAAIGTEGQNTNDLQLLSTTAIRFYTSSDLVLSNERMRITSGGNVGIGTTSPSERLHIVGSTRITDGQYFIYDTRTSAENRNWVLISNANVFGDFAIRQSNAKDGNPLSAGTDRIVINPSGNVGIGTTSPAHRLDVNGLINSTNGISVGGEGVSRFWTGTQAAYDAITTKVSTTVYLIT
jgi:hypothetical protein